MLRRGNLFVAVAQVKNAETLKSTSFKVGPRGIEFLLDD
jgi:hypothetical protein